MEARAPEDPKEEYGASYSIGLSRISFIALALAFILSDISGNAAIRNFLMPPIVLLSLVSLIIACRSKGIAAIIIGFLMFLLSLFFYVSIVNGKIPS
ncbi:hypothetical protein KEM60_00285 [Austwickia sp. TVS 96-490-7B]|uniref:hypothetical protein n=1 Tax=Austwickia sp. TVS 96-490-7B TaxID=2830843 RepID=UPI001C59F79C|nr:hypothetical protein [Austwickia sp. TVS 96-490-7B]MBW3084102.1 hypothetical protein [Austwickia sp. TVS 96-490-7B]